MCYSARGARTKPREPQCPVRTPGCSPQRRSPMPPTRIQCCRRSVRTPVPVYAVPTKLFCSRTRAELIDSGDGDGGRAPGARRSTSGPSARRELPRSRDQYSLVLRHEYRRLREGAFGGTLPLRPELPDTRSGLRGCDHMAFASSGISPRCGHLHRARSARLTCSKSSGVLRFRWPISWSTA
jgi:hypothetical protein